MSYFDYETFNFIQTYQNKTISTVSRTQLVSKANRDRLNYLRSETQFSIAHNLRTHLSTCLNAEQKFLLSIPLGFQILVSVDYTDTRGVSRKLERRNALFSTDFMASGQSTPSSTHTLSRVPTPEPLPPSPVSEPEEVEQVDFGPCQPTVMDLTWARDFPRCINS